ncbi:MAG TPA: hypothetical protein PKD64_06855 [Pirellulaceae bacterium]|nr:hypothetical protein [Pirellulaceae bacterium]HMO91902.1 hypothetical protein [Pirellulaceae bacterium]
MNDFNEIFADGVGEITLSGGMVRMDFFTIVGKGESENVPRVRVKNRVILPPDGFLRSFTAMEDLVKKLVDAGVIKRRDDITASVDGNSASRPTMPSPPPKSPNF